MTNLAPTYSIGQRVTAEIFEGDWRPATIIGERVRANGQTYYRLSVPGLRIDAPQLTAKRIRAAS